MRLNEIFELQQVRKRRRKHRRAVGQRHGIVQRIRLRRVALQAPRAVALGVFHQRKRSRGRLDAALGVHFDRFASAHLVAQRRPIETEIRRHTRVRRDAKFVFDEETVDGGHGAERKKVRGRIKSGAHSPGGDKARLQIRTGVRAGPSAVHPAAPAQFFPW